MKGEHFGTPRTRKVKLSPSEEAREEALLTLFSASARAVSFQMLMLEGLSWQAVWPFLNVPEDHLDGHDYRYRSLVFETIKTVIFVI